MPTMHPIMFHLEASPHLHDCACLDVCGHDAACTFTHMVVSTHLNICVLTLIHRHTNTCRHIHLQLELDRYTETQQIHRYTSNQTHRCKGTQTNHTHRQTNVAQCRAHSFTYRWHTTVHTLWYRGLDRSAHSGIQNPLFAAPEQ